MRQQTIIFSAKQEAVIKAIYFAKKKKEPTLIAIDSLSNGRHSNDPKPENQTYQRAAGPNKWID
jgi:hypothetical protein